MSLKVLRNLAMAVTRARRTRAPKPSTRPPLEGANIPDLDDTLCEECRSGDYAEEILLCDKCDRGYHMFCLRPIIVTLPKGSWFCSSCADSKRPNLHATFPLVQTKIIDFFRIQRSLGSTEKQNQQDNQKKRKRGSKLAVTKKRRKLLPFTPSEDYNSRLQQMASLATALTASGAEFSDKLTYRPGMAPISANLPALEMNGMQVLSNDDIDTLNLCKSMMGRGECSPLMVVFDPIEGFTVEADKFIKDLTIITEYVGDVDYLKHRENDYDGDSMMTLLTAANPHESLVICPEKRSNIARFINGINNHTPNGKKKQNLKCVRYNVNGEARVLLIANRNIAKGERLYYDYNGYEDEYPTEHFV